MNNAALSHVISWTQLQPGTLRRHRDALWIDDMRVARRKFNLACRGEGTVAPGTSFFGLLDDAKTIARWSGDPVATNHIATTSDYIDVCTDGPASFLTLSLGPRSAEVIGFRSACLIRNPFKVAQLRRYLHRLLADSMADRTRPRRAGDDLLRLLSGVLDNDSTTIAASQAKDRRVSAVRACQRYVLEHLERSVTLRDLAEISGVGVRSLFNAFEAVTGLSPMAYLRAQRLNRVREVLLDTTRENTRIIDVAGEWGFWHMGHFANAYATMFGETPSTTLNRAYCLADSRARDASVV